MTQSAQTQELDYVFLSRRDHFLWKMSFSHPNNPLYETILKACASNVGMFKSLFFKSQNKLNGNSARAASFALTERLAIGYCLDSPYFDLQEFHRRFWIWTHVTYGATFGESMADDIEMLAIEHFNELPLRAGFPSVFGDFSDIDIAALKILQVTSKSNSVNQKNVEKLGRDLNIGLLVASQAYSDYRYKVDNSNLDEDLFFSEIGSVIQQLENTRQRRVSVPDLPFSITSDDIAQLRLYQPFTHTEAYQKLKEAIQP